MTTTDTDSTAVTYTTGGLAPQPPQPQPPQQPPGIPAFEGEEVVSTVAKIVSAGGLEIDDAVWRMDHYVQLLVTTRVLGVDHPMNEKTGKLQRVHKLKAIEVDVVKSWDPLTGLEVTP